jgi:hypothetical protein
VAWTEHGLDFGGAQPPPGLAACFVHQERYYFYWAAGAAIHLATSTDLVTWTPHPKNPVLQADGVHVAADGLADPYVFYHAPEGLWWMLCSARQPSGLRQRAGCVGLAKSADLKRWQFCSPLWAPGIGPECAGPQLFEQQGRWFLLYRQRNTRYRLAHEPSGPFRRPPIRNLYTHTVSGGTRAVWNGSQWLTFPIVLDTLGDQGAPLARTGCLGLPRQLMPQIDGAITTRPAEAVLAALHRLLPAGDPLLTARPLAGQWAMTTADTWQCQDDAGGSLLLPSIAPDSFLTCELLVEKADADVHLLLRTDAELTRGYQLSLHPRSGQLSLRPISLAEDDRVLASRWAPIPVNRPFQLQVVMAGDVLEVFLDQRASLSARLSGEAAGAAVVEFRDSKGRVSQVTYRPLRPANA